jgi:hypothetical protein
VTQDEHNQLVEDYVRQVVGDVLKAGGGFADVMVVMESVLTGTMLLLAKHFSIRPDVVAGLVEAAVVKAVERFEQLEPRMT